MFGKSKKRAELQKMAIEGVLDIVYMNARHLGYHLSSDKIPRELADKGSFIGAVGGLAESTCKMLGAPSQETFCSVISNLFKNGRTVTVKDVESAMQIIEKSFGSPDCETAFLEACNYLDSLAGVEASTDNEEMLFLVDYMRLDSMTKGDSSPTNEAGESNDLDYMEPASGPDSWEEYVDVSAGWMQKANSLKHKIHRLLW